MNTITWRKRFELPQETNWGLHQKKCFVDAYNVKPLDGYKSSMNHAQEIHLGDMLTRSRGRYCPECANHGYHAWFHQLLCFDYCILHPDQKLLDIDYPMFGSQEKSFFQQLGVRPIDLMDNAYLRHEIETKLHLDFDRIVVIDIMEYRWGAQSCFRTQWYESTFQALRERIDGKSFTAARKVASIEPGAHKRITEWADDYLKNFIVPWNCNRLVKRTNDIYFASEESLSIERRRLNEYWEYRISPDDYNTEVLNLMMHKVFVDLCEKLGGEEKYDAILSSIHDRIFDTQLCDYHTYGKIIALILTSHYCSASDLTLLSEGLKYKSGIYSYCSKLLLCNIDMDQVVNIRSGNYRNMRVPILAAILKDVFSHTATVLGDLMAGKRCLTGGGVTADIYSSFFCLPVSQYLAIWNAGTVEVWACDPNLDALFSNISLTKEIYDKIRRFEKPPEMAQV